DPTSVVDAWVLGIRREEIRRRGFFLAFRAGGSTARLTALLAVAIVLLNCKPMKLRFCVLLCASTALAQTGSQGNSASTSAKEVSHVTQATIRQSGTEALTREQARSKINLCAKAQTGGNAAIGACLEAEGKTTEQEYLTYARSI